MKKTLWDLIQGEQRLVSGFHQDLDESYRVRLMELGFHPGELVSCVQTPSLGAPKLYRVHNTIYSLDDHIARMVDTRELN
jgi:Fe2+ transport system protein FeoA